MTEAQAQVTWFVVAKESVPPKADRASEKNWRERGTIEGGLAEILKRAIEAGARNLTPDNIKQLARELKLPKEALSFAFSQVEETKNGLYRAVAGELRQFLENSNVGDELARALTKLTFEVKMQVRFVPSENEKKGAAPKVSTQVRVRKSDEEPTSAHPTSDAVTQTDETLATTSSGVVAAEGTGETVAADPAAKSRRVD